MNNKNDNLTVENENLLQIDEIKTNTNTETTINTNKPNGPPPLFNQVTRSDLLLFKEDFLRSMRELKNEINKIMNDKFDDCSKLIEEANKKLYDFETDKKTFIQKLNFLEDKHEILSKMSETTNNLKNELNLHMLHITNCQKDISNMGFKYDKMIINNLMVPGIIGPMCKFNNLKEYIIYYSDELLNYKSNNISYAEEIKFIKKKVEENFLAFQTFQKTIEQTNESFTQLKVEQLEQKMETQLNLIDEKINSVRIHNMAYLKNFLEKEKNLDEYLGKMEVIKKEILESNEKTIEKTKNLNKYTISKLEKNINESINLKKCVLELSNIFAKQKRIYGDDNLNENKREVINNFTNMISNLIKELINSKNNNIKNNKIFEKFGEHRGIKDLKSGPINDTFYIHSDLNRANSRKASRKYTDRSNNVKNNIYNILNENNKDYKVSQFCKKKTITNNQIFSNNIFMSSSQKKINNIHNNSSKNIKSIHSNENKNNNNNIIVDEKNNSSIVVNESDTFEEAKQKNNDLNLYIYENNKNNIKKNNEFKIEKISSLSNVPKKDISNKDDTIKTLTINKYLPPSKNNSIKSGNNLQKDSTTLSIKEKKISRNYKIYDFKNTIFKNEDTKNKKISAYTEKKYIKNEEISKAKDIPPIQLGQTQTEEKTKIIKNILGSSSSNQNLYHKEKADKIIINNKINKRPFSKNEKYNLGSITRENGMYTSVSYRPKHITIDSNANKFRTDNKEIYFDKNIETHVKYIKDKDIIDRPLLSNRCNFELIRERGGLENKLLELEYFTKKKFDELVKEIKNFIPIHFNAYLKDYTIVEIGKKHKINKY